MKIEIYGKDDCGYCKMAESLAKGVTGTITVKKLDTDFTRDELLEKFPEAKSYPQIVVDEVHIGGYNEFAAYLRDNILGTTLIIK